MSYVTTTTMEAPSSPRYVTSMAPTSPVTVPGAYPGFTPGVLTAPQLNLPVFQFTPNMDAPAPSTTTNRDVKVAKKKPAKKKSCGCC